MTREELREALREMATGMLSELRGEFGQAFSEAMQTAMQQHADREADKLEAQGAHDLELEDLRFWGDVALNYLQKKMRGNVQNMAALEQEAFDHATRLVSARRRIFTPAPSGHETQ